MKRVGIPLFGATLLVVLSPVSSALAAADVPCYIDSVAGDDTKDGLSEATARASWYAIPTTCTTVKYKRGSVFNLATGDTVFPPKVAAGGVTVPASRQVTTLTNYGDATLSQPKFVKVRQFGSGGMINGSNLTIDGLYFDGTESSVAMKTISQGIVIMGGSNVKILNNEITNSDIGMMLSGTGNLVQGNYVHDLHVVIDAPPGVDPNLVGGAEGIFVNGSNNEVAYNTFIDCSDYAEWTGGDCDGGATEVAVPGGVGGTVDGLKIHHNFGYNNCGFFEVSSMGALVGVGGGIADGGTAPKGTFSNSTFYNNVSIDSGWISLLQVSNTDLKNIKWENNTLVQHKGSVNAGIMAVVYTACSSGMCGGALMPNTVYWTNNLWAFDGVQNMGADKNFVQTTNLIVTKDPGFVNLKGMTSADYDLTAAATGAIDQGTALPEITLDFLNRPVPNAGGKPDIGAFEYNAGEPTSTPPTYTGGPIKPSHGNLIGQGGQSGSGGAVGAGGTTTKPAGTGGATTVPKGTGGATTVPGGTGGSTTVPKGSGGSTSTPGGTGGATSGSGGKTGSGGASGSGGSTTTPSGAGGSSVASNGGSGGGGAQGAGGATGISIPSPVGSSGCSCRLDHQGSSPGIWACLIGLALFIMRHRSRRR